MLRTRSICIATTAVVGLAALSGCSAAAKATGQAAQSAKSGLGSVADALALASTKTSAYDSVKMSMHVTVGTQGSVTMDGSVGWKPVAMDMTVSSASLASLGGGTMRMMMTGQTMYMGSPGVAAFKGKHWMKLDLSSLGTSGQQISQMLNQSGSESPSVQLKLLTSAEGVKRVGQETVDGVPTTHYAGTVDVKALYTAMAAQDPAFKSLVTTAEQQGMTTENVNLWVSAQSLPVRVTTTGVTSSGTVSASVDYSGYSTSPVAITAPPASDTLDYSQLLAGANG